MSHEIFLTQISVLRFVPLRADKCVDFARSYICSVIMGIKCILSLKNITIDNDLNASSIVSGTK